MSKEHKPKGAKREKLRRFTERTKRRWNHFMEFLEGKNTLAGRVFAMISKNPLWITGGALMIGSSLFLANPVIWFISAGPIFLLWIAMMFVFGGLTLTNLPKIIREAKARFTSEELEFANSLRLFNEERVKRGLPEWDGRGPLLDNVSTSDLSSGGFVSAGAKAQAIKMEPLAIPARRYDLSDYSGKMYATFGNARVRIL